MNKIKNEIELVYRVILWLKKKERILKERLLNAKKDFSSK